MSTLGYILVALLIVAAIVGIGFLINYYDNPFKNSYPKKVILIDISGKRQPSIDDIIDEYFLSNGIKQIETMKLSGENFIINQKQIYKDQSHRLEQLAEVVEANKNFTFIIQRKQTKYRQVNYVRQAYTVIDKVAEYEMSYEQLIDIYSQLKEINFETTRSNYHSKNQRKLMTKELRKKIMIRDNYTCQCCGKYMGDEVGLQIDHIKPVAKGGKTVESNLQVLCSKCNASKSDKLI